jgi:hypothetical protein
MLIWRQEHGGTYRYYRYQIGTRYPIPCIRSGRAVAPILSNDGFPSITPGDITQMGDDSWAKGI